MILSVSRRTDIPSFYSEWFLERLKEGFLYVRNPFNKKMVSKILLSPNEVEMIVFWTKNALPLIKYLDEMENLGYDKYCFLYTITNYGKDIEKNLVDKNIIIDNFIDLSRRIGKEKMILRYDPIFVNEKYNLDFHKKSFENICRKLNDHCDKVIISFIDIYEKNKKYFKEVDFNEKMEIIESFKKIAKENEMEIQSCCEDYEDINLKKAPCISSELIKNVTGYDAKYIKDNGQRKGCLCFESVDIGTYDSCKNGCIYCYATKNAAKAKSYDLKSPILCDEIRKGDIIKMRNSKRITDSQLKFLA